jgi:hypothetical protein
MPDLGAEPAPSSTSYAVGSDGLRDSGTSRPLGPSLASRTVLVLLDRDHLDEVQARRHAWGADVFDEVWDGVPHLGQQVGRHPDLQQQLAVLLGDAAGERGLVAVLGAYEPRPPGSPFGESAARIRGDSAGTAALVVEIIDADADEERLSALAADRVNEVMLVDLGQRTVRWLALGDGEYRPTEASRVIDLRPRALAESINWPSDPDR